MFLATTQLVDRRNPLYAPKIVTFTCQEHAPNLLITLISKYQRLVNKLNDASFVFQLLDLVDLGQTFSARDIEALGAVVLSSEIITNLRMQKPRSGFLIQLHPADISLEDSEDDKPLPGETKDFYYSLPAIGEMKSFSELSINDALRKLHEQGNLFLTIDEDSRLSWVMTEKNSSTFVTYKKGKLPTIQEAWVHLHVPTKTYQLRAEGPPKPAPEIEDVAETIETEDQTDGA